MEDYDPREIRHNPMENWRDYEAREYQRDRKIIDDFRLKYHNDLIIDIIVIFAFVVFIYLMLTWPENF